MLSRFLHRTMNFINRGRDLTATTRAALPLVVAAIAACLMPAASRAADAPPALAAAVDRAFRPLLQQHDVPGIAVAVTVDGRQYFFSYGVAAKEGNAPVTKDTLFEIGSISKTFTATLATYAQAQGKLSLDDHPGKYVPQLRGAALDKASLLNLATFSAGGLPLQFSPAVTNDAAMVTFFKQWKPSAAPGAQRRYSNPSIGLFGRITATAMNGKFADLVEGELFPKFGLARSYPCAESGDGWLRVGLQGGQADAGDAGRVRSGSLWRKILGHRHDPLHRSQHPARHA
jgi:beta-lactamase class C